MQTYIYVILGFIILAVILAVTLRKDSSDSNTGSVSEDRKLIITGVFDGPLDGGNPRGIELYAIKNITDLSEYGIGIASNGTGTTAPDYRFPQGTMDVGEYIHLIVGSSEDIVQAFNNFFGGGYRLYTDLTVAPNGDDAIRLFRTLNSTHEVIDTFGDVDVDGTGQGWEYKDGWAYRTGNSNNASNPTGFIIDDWTFSGKDAWDNAPNNAESNSVMPIGTYPIPPG